MNNFNYALRQFKRNPGFAFAAVLILALGIGANAAVFSLIDSVLLQPLPYPNGEQLVHLSQSRQLSEDATSPIAPVRLEEWNEQSSAFEVITGYYMDDASDTTGEFPERIRRAWVAPRFLETWKVPPAIGRGFNDGDHEVGATSVVLISDRYWKTRFGSDPEVLSRDVRIGSSSYSVVGVMPESFLFPEREIDLWFPVSNSFAQNTPQNREMRWYIGIGRIAEGTSFEAASADLGRIQKQLGEQYPETDQEFSVKMLPLKSVALGDISASLWLVYGAVSVLLLITCVNISALLLSRAARRSQEVAVRLSLGAPNRAVIAQLLTETSMLTLVGAVVGLVLAAIAIGAFQALMPELPRIDELSIDFRIVAYTIAIAAVVAMISGVLPALRSLQAGASLTVTANSRVSARHTTQWSLVGVQVALSITLLAGAVLLVRSIENLGNIDPGFEANNILTFRVSGSWSESVDYPSVTQRIDRTLQELNAIPGVESVASSWNLPGLPVGYEEKFDLAEGRAETEPDLIAEWRTVSTSYFETLGIPLVAGELCRQEPGSRTASEMMVNRSFVETYFGGGNVIGRSLTWESGSLSNRITGIVGDARETGLDKSPVPTVYSCHSAPSPMPMYLVKVNGDALAIASVVRNKMRELEPLRSVYDVEPLDQRISGAFSETRLRTLLLSFFAGAALTLACVGMYSTLSYIVSLRRREIGLRMAMGAQASRIAIQILSKAMKVVCVASLVGLALSYGLAQTLSSMLFGISPTDPLALSSVIGIVVVLAVFAALLPARRASRVQPTEALRYE